MCDRSDWRPSAVKRQLEARALLYRQIRQFFAERRVLEVETPLLGAAPAADLHLHSLNCQVETPQGARRLYLQTSPEFAMKRLLAAGSGAIYQLGKAFRDGESGRFHNPEFTMLEWYQPGFDHHALMDEMDAFLAATLGTPAAERLTYQEAFEHTFSINPHQATVEELAHVAGAHGINWSSAEAADRDTWLHLLLSHGVEPQLGIKRPTFLMDFPASQAALARIRPAQEEAPAVAERFEVYVQGVELANGFHELTDAQEQRRRFAADNAARAAAGLLAVPIDEGLLAALEAGIPACAGVALGVDRLLMLITGAEHLDEVLTFPLARL